MKVINQILKGELAVSYSSTLKNPMLKALLVIMPLVLGSASTWGKSIAPVNLFAILLILWVCIKINLREHRLTREIMNIIFSSGLFAVLISFHGTLTQRLVSIVSGYPIFNILKPNTVLFLLSFFLAAHAVRNISSRDALWFGRAVLRIKQLRYLYFIIIVVYFVLTNGLPFKFHIAWNAALYKSRLRSKNIHHAFAFLKIFINTFIMELSQVPQVASTLLYERGFFSNKYSDSYYKYLNVSDAVVMTILIVFGTILFVMHM